MLEIRQENINDYEEVYNVVKIAFEKAEHSDGNEHDLVVDLRKSDNFILYFVGNKLLSKGVNVD